MGKVKKNVDSLILYLIRRKRHKFYSSQFKKYLKDLGFSPDEKVEGEEAYINKWSQFGCKVEPYSYRLFSRYCGKTADIVPEDIGRCFLEEALNPSPTRGFYSDKNTYRMYLDKKHLPLTLLSRINGGPIKDSDGKVVDEVSLPENVDKVILKPSVDSSSGRGVECYKRTNKGWLSDDGKSLDIESLKKYRNDFILQEAVKQHSYVSQFCSTAVNTFRVAIYRSVVDDSVNVVGSLMRIGKEGQYVDNAHAGGRYIGIDYKTGKLNDYVCDTYGNMSHVWNGVDFQAGEYLIPNWDKIVEFARYIGSSVPHLRLLALDLCLDESGNPILIEFNTFGFSFWLFMFSGSSPLGKFTDEVIEYSKTNIPNKVKRQICHS